MTRKSLCNDRGAAYPGELMGLQDPEQVDLHLYGDVTHFIEEEGPGIGHFQPAFLGIFGVGEGAFFMAEELAFQEVLRKGPAVDGNKGRIDPRTLRRGWPGPPVLCPCRFRR